MMMAASALVLGGCTKGEIDTPQNTEMATVRFSAGEVEVRSTRATSTDTYYGVIAASNDAGATWEESFPLGSLTFKGNPEVYSFDTTAPEIGSVLTVYNNDTQVSQIQLTPTNEESFYSLGVASENVTLTQTNNVYVIAATAQPNDVQNDYIWAKTVTPLVANKTEVVKFDYTHVMSKLCIVLNENKDNTTAKVDDADVKISQLSNLGLVRNGLLNITEGNVVKDAANTTTLTEINLTEGDNTSIEYYVIPQKTAQETTFHLVYNKAEYDVKVPAGLEFVAGKCRVLNLTLKGSGIDFSSTLKDWEDDKYDIIIGL